MNRETLSPLVITASRIDRIADGSEAVPSDGTHWTKEETGFPCQPDLRMGTQSVTA